jgi:poly-gamma-glutamate capsule biosynthesis protein CapA/YwtB (metallophosphatase superfamily)
MTNNVIDLFAAFATDVAKENKGVETTIPGCGDTKFMVARANNATYNRLISSLYKRHRAVLDSKGDEANAKSDEILAEVYAKAILLGWVGAITFKGKELTYSEANAKTLLLLKDFRAAVESVASDMNTFKAVQDDEDVKN